MSYHYATIARAIALIEAEGRDLPLAELAARMDMSESHFQRVFSAWAGVSPKRYQQYLSLGLARTRLQEQASLQQVSLDLGLSSASRLHDLFLTWEAMSPGDYAKGGAGLRIGWAECDTPFGPAIAMATSKGLCGLGFVTEAGPQAAFTDLSLRWPKADYHPDPQAGALAQAALQGRGGHLHLIGAPFQIKVWEALLALKGAEVTSYGALAQAIDSPKAVRAVGTAVGRNPLGYLIPCHRALRANGDLGGYHWGLTRKRAILAWESAKQAG